MMKIKKTEIVKILYAIAILTTLSIILGICTIVLTVVPCDLNLIKVMLKDGLIVFLNVLPIFFVMLFFFFLCNKVWVSFLVTSILTFVIAEINRFKVMFRDDPFYFEDVFLVNEAKDMMSKYPLRLDKPSIVFLFVIIGVTVACIWFKKLNMRTKVIRLSGLLVVGLVAVLSYSQLYINNEEMHNNMWHYQFGNQWKAGNQYMARGVIYSFLHSIPDAIDTPPEGYKAKEVERILDKYDGDSLSSDKQVHVISIMLEAYNDFSDFNTVEFVENPYYNFHNIQQESYYGKLYTDIFAAGTIKTERSFLTGYSDTDMKGKPTQSYVRYFKEQGYYAEAMHPCYGWFYDRRNVNEQLGFDNFYYYENKFQKVDESTLKREMYGGYLNDYDFVDYIIQGYEDAVKDNHMYFNFSVTYQNHGPYSTEKQTDKEYVKWQEGYTETEYNILNNYLDGIAGTDEALGKLYDYVKQQHEPVVLILFGDHNPWLGENNSVYQMLGIDLNLDTSEGAANYYQTPYLFYANAAAQEKLQKDFRGQGNTISPMFLMGEFFECAGVEGPKYMNYLRKVRETYSVLNPVYVCKEGKYILRSAEQDNTLLKEQEKVEYFLKKYRVK